MYSPCDHFCFFYWKTVNHAGRSFRLGHLPQEMEQPFSCWPASAVVDCPTSFSHRMGSRVRGFAGYFSAHDRTQCVEVHPVGRAFRHRSQSLHLRAVSSGLACSHQDRQHRGHVLVHTTCLYYATSTSHYNISLSVSLNTTPDHLPRPELHRYRPHYTDPHTHRHTRIHYIHSSSFRQPVGRCRVQVPAPMICKS